MREKQWYKRSSVIASVAVLLVALLALLITVGTYWFGRSGDGATSHLPQPQATATPPAVSGCATDTGSSTPSVPPKGVEWKALGPLILPYGGNAFGPCRVTDTTASGFAHTPTGALIAAAQILGRSSTTDPVEVAAETIRTQFSAGADRDRLLAATQAAAGQRLSPDHVGRFAAYSITSYSSDTVVLTLAQQSDILPGQYAALTVVLRWADGDWRMVAPTGGTWASAGRVVVDLTGFVAWGPR